MTYHITARHKKTFVKVDMFYNSLTQAKKDNPGYEEFTVVGGTK